MKPIPAGKKGFKVEVGKKLDDKELQSALRSHGPAANPGDTVQVTGIEFRSKEIVIEINGGGKKQLQYPRSSADRSRRQHADACSPRSGVAQE